jgi:N-methylhydantoinase B
MASKIVGIHIDRGQKLRLETPGGGGYGLASDRDPQSVARDLRLGYITAGRTEPDYGVVMRSDGSVDDAATRELRAREATQ